MATRQVVVDGRRFMLPFANDIRPLTAQERLELKVSITKSGRVHTPVLVDSSNPPNVIDGANRLCISAEIGLSISCVPIMVQDIGFEEARELCLELNLTRCHLTTQEQSVLREKRKAKVVELREQGKTQREIAEAMGVSQMQVQRDLQASTVSVETHVSTETVDEEAEQEAVVIEKRREGKSLREIAKETGKSKDAVARTLEKLEADGKDVEPEGGTVTGKDKRKRKARSKRIDDIRQKLKDREEEKIKKKKHTVYEIIRKIELSLARWHHYEELGELFATINRLKEKHRDDK